MRSPSAGIDQFFALEPREAIETFDRAMAIARELGLPTPARALGFRGDARLDAGDAGGMEDFRASIALSEAAGQGRDIAINTINMGVWVWLYEGPAAGIVPIRAAIAHAARFGFGALSTGMTLLSLQVLMDMGAYDEALEIFDRLNVPGDGAMRQTYGAQYRIYAFADGGRRRLPASAELEAMAREGGSPEKRVQTRATAAAICGVLGDHGSAAA